MTSKQQFKANKIQAQQQGRLLRSGRASVGDTGQVPGPVAQGTHGPPRVVRGGGVGGCVHGMCACSDFVDKADSSGQQFDICAADGAPTTDLPALLNRARWPWQQLQASPP